MKLSRVFYLLAVVGVVLTLSSYAHAAEAKCYAFSNGYFCFNATTVWSNTGQVNLSYLYNDYNNYTTSTVFSRLGSVVTLTTGRNGMTGLTTSFTDTNDTTALLNEISARQSIGNWSLDKSLYNFYNNITSLQVSSGAYYNNITSLQVSSGAYYNNITSLQTGQNGINTSVNSLNASIFSIGNWSFDKPNYTTSANLVTALGNWSLDKSSYSTTSAANLLYYSISNPFGFYNVTTLPAQINYYTNITSLQNSNTTTNSRIDSLNLTKLSIGSTINRTLVVNNYAACSAGYAVTNENETERTCTAFGTSSLTLAQVVSGVGNWSLDKSSYSTTAIADNRYGTSNLTLTQVTSANGNWSLDKSSYSTSVQSWLKSTTLSGTGATSACTYGIANYTLVNGSAPVIACAAQQFTEYANVTSLQNSNTTTNSRIDALNNTKAIAGNTSACTYGIANISIGANTIATTCAAQQAGGSGTVTSVGLAVLGSTAVTAQGPITISGNLNLTFQNATTAQAGLLTSTDWNIFNNKGISNLTLAQVVSGVGNWSLDKTSYFTSTQIDNASIIRSANGSWVSSAVGNYSAVSGLLYTNITALQTYRDANYINVTGINSSKALAGSSGACAYGVANFTTLINGAPTVTCAAAQGGGGLLGGIAGVPAVWTGATTIAALTINSSMINSTNTPVADQYPKYASNGQVTWTTVAGTGTLTGGGISGYLGLWNSTTSVSNSSIWENNTQVNITKDVYIGNGTGTAYITGNTGSNDLTISATNTNISGRVNAYNGMYDYDWIEGIHTQAYFCDFLVPSAVTMCYPNYLGAALTGSAPSVVGSKATPGVVNITSTTATNTGYYFMTGVDSFLISGGEDFKSQIHLPTVPSGNTSRIRIGFGDSITVAAQIVDGVYWDINSTNTSIIGTPVVVSNTLGVLGSPYTFEGNKWYTVRIVVNATATGSAFYVYNDTGVLVHSTSITATHPTAAGRTTGAGIIATVTSAGSAREVVAIDYMSTQIDQTRRYG